MTPGRGKSSAGGAPDKGPKQENEQRLQKHQVANTVLCNSPFRIHHTHMYITFILFSKKTLRAEVVSHVIPSVGCVNLNQQWICLFSWTLGLHIGIYLLSVTNSLCMENWHSLQYIFKTILPSSSLVVFFDFETKSDDLQEPRRIKTRDQKQRELGPSYWSP